MIFKKKYTRSEWMEGLLEAEQLIQKGFSYHKNDGCHIWFINRDKLDFCYNQGFTSTTIGVPVARTQRCVGVMDYLEHIENNVIK